MNFPNIIESYKFSSTLKVKNAKINKEINVINNKQLIIILFEGNISSNGLLLFVYS